MSERVLCFVYSNTQRMEAAMVRVLPVIGVLFLLGCATPSGTYRDYFGFGVTPQQRTHEERTEPVAAPREQSPRIERTSVVVVPEWSWADWYAPWCPYPVYGVPWWGYRWYSVRYWWHYWHCPPAVVIVPVEREPQPPVRVRTFGPARGSPDRVSEGVPEADPGGGRRRGTAKAESVRLAQEGQQSQSRASQSEEGGGRRRHQSSASEARLEDSGGGRSRGAASP